MSPLCQAFADYLTVRRACGFKLKNAERMLRQFVEFAEAQGASFITTALALCWAQKPAQCQPAHWARRLQMVRQFARYCSTLDPRTEIPPTGLLPQRFERKAPYLYSDSDILRLVAAAQQMPSPTGLGAATYSTLLGLIAATGMRSSEPLRLDRQDVDFDHGVITIRRSKFDKSRWLPLHPSTLKVLRRYQSQRDRLCPQPQAPSFFLSEQGTRVSQRALYQTFVQLSRQLGWRGPAGRRGPRLHDLRHTFAVRTILGWYQAGLDVERRLPQLTTYLGHAHIDDTYWYLSATPQLLRSAALRLDEAEHEARS